MSRFDDESAEPVQAQTQSAQAAPGVETVEQLESRGKLYCPVHLVTLVCYSSAKKRGKAYYKCPVPSCNHTDSKPRSKCRFAGSPQLCPSCSKPCEVKKYQRYTVLMACPQCEFDIEIPRPDIEHQRQRYWREDSRGEE